MFTYLLYFVAGFQAPVLKKNAAKMTTQQVQIQTQGGQTIIAPAGVGGQYIRVGNVNQTSNILQNGNTIMTTGWHPKSYEIIILQTKCLTKMF
jgi:methyl coenzyme M reductase subunit C-like uncharacterized protein (methanogenesis marker protein 7)